MKKDNIIRIASIVGVVGVLYLVYKKLIKPMVENGKSGGGKSDDKKADDKKVDDANASTDYEKYTVTTTTTNLNVRETPSANGKKIGSLTKGQQILLKKSTTDGWMEFTTNGKTTMGYVSSQFVTKQPTTTNFSGDNFVDDGGVLVNRGNNFDPLLATAPVRSRGLVNRSSGRAIVNRGGVAIPKTAEVGTRGIVNKF